MGAESLGAHFASGPEHAIGLAIHEEVFEAERTGRGFPLMRGLSATPVERIAAELRAQLKILGTQHSWTIEELARERLSSRGGTAELFRQVRKIL
jgi:hypothetical protein